MILGALLFYAGLGWLLGCALGAPRAGFVAGAAAGALLSVLAYAWGDRLVLASARAKTVGEEEEPRLHNIVEGVCLASGLPKPRIHVVPESAPNAFSTGRGPKHASIALTRGLLDAADRLELEGVVAHELSHIRDGGVLLGTLAAVSLLGPLLVAQLLLSSRFSESAVAPGGRRDGPLGVLLLAVGLPFLALAAVLSVALRLSPRPGREYAADAAAVRLTRYPPGLRRALERVAASDAPTRLPNNATAHLWLSHPAGGRSSSLLERLLSTHPSIQGRIRDLEEM